MSEVETESRVAALRSVNDDFAKLAGEQRLRIAELEAALERIATYEVECCCISYVSPYVREIARRALSPAKPGAAGT